MPFTYWLDLHNSTKNEDTHGMFKMFNADRQTELSVNSLLIEWILDLWWINRILVTAIKHVCCILYVFVILYTYFVYISALRAPVPFDTTQPCTAQNAAWKYHLLVDTPWKHSACKVYRLKMICGDNVRLSIDCTDRNTLFSHIMTRQRILYMPREHNCNCTPTTFVRSNFL